MKVVSPPERLRGEVSPPGDKSLGHRALIFNALAAGKARVDNFCPGADPLSTLSCLRSLGVSIEYDPGPPPRVEVAGVGGGLQEPTEVLDCGNSATTLRLLAGLLASQPFLAVLSGDASLRSRPVDRVIQPLRLMGAQIWGRAGDRLAPLVVRGGRLKGIDYRLPVASAQVKSALVLAGLWAEGDTYLEEPAPSRDHTERMLRAMGASIESRDSRIHVSPLISPLKPLSSPLPGDISSAAFFLVAGAVHPDASIRLRSVGVNPTRAGVVEVLRRMGANIKIKEGRPLGGEPVADLEVTSSELHGVELGGDIIPRLIDEVPVLAVAAACASGATIIRGAAELRVKEADRIGVMVAGLRRLGADADELPDGMIIRGGRKLHGATVNSHGDHRLAMAFAVAGLVAEGETVIEGAEGVEVSYPAFWQELDRILKRKS